MARYHTLFTVHRDAWAVGGGAAAAPGIQSTPAGTAALGLARADRRDADRADPSRRGRPPVPGVRLHRHRDHRAEHVGLGGLERRPVHQDAAVPGPGAALGQAGPHDIPAARRWRLVLDGGILPDHVHPAVVVPHVSQGGGDRTGHAHPLGLRLGDLALPRAGLHSPDHDGQLVGGGAVRGDRAPELDRDLLSPLRQPVLQPVPHAFHRLPVWIDHAVRHARRHHPGHHTVRWRPRNARDHRSRERHGTRRAVLALDDGVQRELRVDPRLDLHLRHPYHAHRRDRHPDDRTVVDNWYLWGVKHGIAPDYQPVLASPPAPPPGAMDVKAPHERPLR